MGEYIRREINIITFSYVFPFGIRFEVLRIPRGWLKRPQYWWLFALQTNSNTSYLTICFIGLILDLKRKII